MKIVRMVLILIISFLYCQQKVISQTWLAKIIPYQTTINDVEKLISAAPDKNLSTKDSYVFLLKEGRLEVDFSLGRCVSGMYGKWNIEKGIVMQTLFHPQGRNKINFYERDVTIFRKEVSGDWVFYRNDKKGIEYTIQTGKVYSISYYGDQNQKPVRCKD